MLELAEFLIVWVLMICTLAVHWELTGYEKYTIWLKVYLFSVFFVLQTVATEIVKI